ncbi:adenylate cyclase, class 1 [Candidatus Magnetomoraceae bacterium gMMP-15]
MNIRIIKHNKKKFLKYNEFRKNMLLEVSKDDAEAVLYMFPWLLSINHIACPGYIENIHRPFRVFNIDNEKEIRKREKNFQRLFSFSSSGSLLEFNANCCWIEGLYTIGSAGSSTQTSHSDCDIWVCIDKKNYDELAIRQLNHKLNLIMEWMNSNFGLPVYFFISELEDIQNSKFGTVDEESCGTAQRNVLKEEFYRTTMIICGKIPFWWLCYNLAEPDKPVNYKEALSMSMNSFINYEIIDFGNFDKIESDEYFGGALWQFNKSLTKPLKSIMKMVLLKMMLEAPPEKLICHQFREAVLSHKEGMFPDPSLFTMGSIFNYYNQKDADNQTRETLEFLKKCFYLRCEMKLDAKKTPLKRELIYDFFKEYKLDFDSRAHLDRFASWDFADQIDVGKRIYSLLVDIYKNMSSLQQSVGGNIDEKDMTVLSTKIVSRLQLKPNKISILQKPGNVLNVPNPTFMLKGKTWQIFVSNDRSKVLISDQNIIKCITYLVWNGLFDPVSIRMLPNPNSPTNITLQEIINIGKKIQTFFGVYNISKIDYSVFFKPKQFIRLLIIINFEKPIFKKTHKQKNNNEFCVIYQNNIWELYIDRIFSQNQLALFFKEIKKNSDSLETSSYAC